MNRMGSPEVDVKARGEPTGLPVSPGSRKVRGKRDSSTILAPYNEDAMGWLEGFSRRR